MIDSAPFGAYAPRGLARWAVDVSRNLPDTWVGRRLVIVLRRLAALRRRGTPVDIEALGARMRVLPGNNICEKKMLFTPHLFDPAELAILADRIGEDFTFVDIGANIGAYSLYVAGRAGAGARILAVEPQPGVFERLVYNIALNPAAAVKPVACAVADKPGELTLFIDRQNSGESSVKIVGSTGGDTIRVPAKTMLGLVTEEGFARLDAVKLDVEGAEDIILEPFFADAPETLHPALLIIEDGSRQWQVDVAGLLNRHGYRLLARTRLNFVYEKTSAGKDHA